jgi:hypothetical protein
MTHFKRKWRVIALIAAVAALAAWILWTRSDSYQVRASLQAGARVVADHPALPPALIVQWFAAAAVHDNNAALRALHSLPAGAARDQSISAMAHALLSAGRIRDSLSVASEIHDTGTLAAALKDLSAALLSSPTPEPGDLAAQIKALIDREHTPAISTSLLSGISGTLAAAGFTSAAATVARQFSDPAEQALAFASLAERFNEAGQTSDAASARGEALKSARGIGAPKQRLAVMMRLMLADYAAGDLPLSRSALDDSVATARALPDADSRALVLPVLARALEKSGDPTAATQVLRQAADAARSLPQPEARAAAFTRILILQRDETEIATIVNELSALTPTEASPALSAAAQSLAASKHLRRARLLADRCFLPADRLTAYTAVLHYSN